MYDFFNFYVFSKKLTLSTVNDNWTILKSYFDFKNKFNAVIRH